LRIQLPPGFWSFTPSGNNFAVDPSCFLGQLLLPTHQFG
jgi:hypothetical protein